MAHRFIRPGLVLLFSAALCGATLTAQRPKAASTDRTLVVMLGTGNPSIDPDRLQAEMRAVYAGHFIVSRDLDVY
jgi:hypothetical protein